MKCFLLVFLSCFFTLGGAFAQSFTHDRIYVDSCDVMLGDNGIFVKINGSVFQTNSILRDDCGNFVFDYEIWRCPECDRDYPAYEKECPWHPKSNKTNKDD